MKKTKKLEIKKVTLRNLDEPTLDAMGGGVSASCPIISICAGSCPFHQTCATCTQHTCVKC